MRKEHGKWNNNSVFDKQDKNNIVLFISDQGCWLIATLDCVKEQHQLTASEKFCHQEKERKLAYKIE